MELANCDVRIFDHPYKVFGYPDEGWFGILSRVGEYKEFNLNYLKSIVRPDSVCLDIGANKGVVTLAMAQLAPRGQIHAFEASDPTYDGLCRTVEASGFDNIKTYSWIVGRERVRGTFFDDFDWCSSSHFVPDPKGTWEMECIDSLELPRVDFIKIDVEGSELEVLEGAMSTLNRCKPVVIMEFNSFALVYYRDMLPRLALRRIMEIFPQVGYFDKSTGGVIRIDNPDFFLRINMTDHGLVDDLVCTWKKL